LRRALDHIVRTDGTFFTIIAYALEGARTRDGRPQEISEEAWEKFLAGDNFQQVSENEPFATLLDYYAWLHERVLREFSSITEQELSLPVGFWESVSMPVEFRLHRFDSHLRQHTIQIEKTLVVIGPGPTEAKRLLRQIYAALAEVEGDLLGNEGLGDESCHTLAIEISQRADEIAAVMAEA
jgi:hypothetical protein